MAVYSYVDDGTSQAALARSAGGASLTLTAGTGVRFTKPAPPSPSAPLKVAVFRGDVRVGVLLATAVAGDVLTIAGPLSGSDFAVVSGDDVQAVPLAEDLLALQDADADLDAAIALCVATADLPAALASYVTTSSLTATLAGYVATADLPAALESYATTSALTTGLAGKQASLPTGSPSSQYLGGDFTFHDLPRKDLTLLARWASSGSADLAAGTLAPQVAICPVDATVVLVAVTAETNGSSGGFTYNITAGGSNLFTAAQSYAASTTTPVVVSSGFASTSIAGPSKLSASIASTGSGVRSITVELWGRPV